MRTKEGIERIRQRAKADLKKDFTKNKQEPQKQDSKKPQTKKYGGSGFGR